MRAVVLTGHGDFDRLVVRDDVPVPKPGSGEVLIRIRAAAVNNTDINTRIGWYAKQGDDVNWSGGAFVFPRIQGADGCGSIVEVGPGVDGGRVGERVIVEPVFRERGRPFSDARYFGSEVDGGFAEFAVAPSVHAHAVDSQLSDVELASFPCSYSAAENMVVRSAITGSDRVLVTGASGGVGSAAVQLSVARGATVIAVASADKHAALRSLGAHEVADRDADLLLTYGPNSFDVVLDVVGGPSWPALLEVLRPGGRYATCGAIAGTGVQLDLRTLYLKDLSLLGCTVLDDGVFAGLVRFIERGDVRPIVSAIFDLGDVIEAQKVFLSKKHVGKIVMAVS